MTDFSDNGKPTKSMGHQESIYCDAIATPVPT